MNSYQIRRLEKEPTREGIIESIEADNTERNKSLIEFIQLLDIIAPPYTIMLDSPWGSGKTFFVKSLQLLLDVANDSDVIGPNEHERTLSLVEQAKQSRSKMIPAYFNAWENDDAGDPMIALFAVLAAQLQTSTKQHELGKAFGSLVELFLETAIPAISALTGATGVIPGNCLADVSKTVLEEIKGSDLVKCYKQRTSLRETINKRLGDALSSNNEKLVVFIDELDRCRPDFAIHLLEQTKSLFQSEHIILVLSCDAAQLTGSLKGAYGEHYDSTRFLERFYDQKVHLKTVDPYKAITGKAFIPTEIGFDRLTSEIFQTKVLTPRDITRLLPNITKARDYIIKRASASYVGRTSISRPLSVALDAFLPLLIFIERDNPNDFDAIIRGAGFQLLYDEGRKYDEFNRAIAFGRERTLAYRNEPGQSKYAKDLYNVIFNSNSAKNRDPDIRETEQRLEIWPNEINPTIFTEFKFPPADDE